MTIQSGAHTYQGQHMYVIRAWEEGNTCAEEEEEEYKSTRVQEYKSTRVQGQHTHMRRRPKIRKSHKLTRGLGFRVYELGFRVNGGVRV